MESCKENIEKISAMIDGELDDSLKAEVLAHIDECPECKSAYDALSFISSALSGELAQPPETLANSIMEKITNKKKDAKPKNPVFIRFTAIAACFALILFGASRLGIFNDKLSFSSIAGSQPQEAYSGTRNADGGEAFVDEYQFDLMEAPPDIPESEQAAEAFPTDVLGTAQGDAENGFKAYGNILDNNHINNSLKNEVALLIPDSAEVRVYKGEYTDSEGKVRDSALMHTISGKQQLEQLSKLLYFSADEPAPEQAPSFTLLIPADYSSSDHMEDLTVKIWLDGEKVIFLDSKTQVSRLAVSLSRCFLEFLDSLSAAQS